METNNYLHTVGATKNNEFTAELYKMDSVELEISTYERNFSTAENNADATAGINGKNHEKFTGTGDEYFYLITRVENTMLFIRAEKQYADSAKAAADIIGY